MYEKLSPILCKFKIDGQLSNIAPIEIGHINETYKITFQLGENTADYVLQKINVRVFTKPNAVMENIDKVGRFLQASDYPKKVLFPIKSIDNQYVVEWKGNYWRLFPFIDNTITYDVVDCTEKAYAAAHAFGEYAQYLNDFEAAQLHYTIPDFHNTNLRFQQFFYLLKEELPKGRKKAAQETIDELIKFRHLLGAIRGIKIPLRVVHSDTKINNVLFDKTTNEPVCVIDLDTLMPGSLIYDYGDMVRTFTPTLDENSDDFKQIAVRKDILKSLRKGYLDGLNGNLTFLEERLLTYGARLIIFEQALRFLTDYLKGNVYYKVAYKEQNLVRAKNQICLLGSLVKI